MCLSLLHAMWIMFSLFFGASGNNEEGAAPEGGQDLKIPYIWCNMYFIPKYGRLQSFARSTTLCYHIIYIWPSFTRSPLIVITLFIFVHLGHTWGKLTPTDGLKLINFYFWFQGLCILDGCFRVHWKNKSQEILNLFFFFFHSACWVLNSFHEKPTVSETI